MGWRALMAAAIGCAPVLAQTADAEAPGDKDVPVKALLKRIEELEASQRQMQQKIDQLTAASTSQSPVQPRPAVAPAAVVEQAADNASDEEHVTTLGPLKLQAFGDFEFGRPWFEQIPPGGLVGTTNSFTVGDFDLVHQHAHFRSRKRIRGAAGDVGLHQ